MKMLLTILLKISDHVVVVMCLWCCCLYLKLYGVIVVKAMRSVHLIISSRVCANLISSFQKGIFDRISMYIGSLLGRREVTFFRRRGLQLLHKKEGAWAGLRGDLGK